LLYFENAKELNSQHVERCKRRLNAYSSFWDPNDERDLVALSIALLPWKKLSNWWRLETRRHIGFGTRQVSFDENIDHDDKVAVSIEIVSYRWQSQFLLSEIQEFASRVIGITAHFWKNNGNRGYSGINLRKWLLKFNFTRFTIHFPSL
jgi:hypothetical protein